MPTTYHDDQRGNATSPTEQPATSMQGNNDGNPSAMSQSATWPPNDEQ